MSRLPKCVKPSVVNYHCLRLIFSYRAVNSVFLPVFIRFIPHPDKPKSAYLTIISAKYLDTLNQIINILRKISFIVGIVPIKQRMIEKRNYSFYVTFVYEFTNEISSRCRVRSVKLVKSTSVIQGKTVVMPCSKRNIFTPDSFSHFYKIFRPIFSYFEFFCIFFVFFLIGFILPIIPFAFTYNAIKTEMNKTIKIKDIALSVGYADWIQFSKTFKKNVGITPLEYRERHISIKK